ncbi:MAG: alpha-glucuronidase, partial [Prevotella sp.]|nr:alpha-glucuronidase [Prevotella sp.]
MKKILLLALSLFVSFLSFAEDGSRLWLRYDSTLVKNITLQIDSTMPDDDGYRIEGHTVSARTEMGLLYGKYAFLRGEQGESHPYFRLRLLNHWDNLDGSIERGYAGKSIFWDLSTALSPFGEENEALIHQYAEANASIGINGTVLNNVNASPKMLTRPYINKVKEIADILRPWGIKVYLSVNFGTPKALGETKTADPLDPQVRRWWQRKAKEIYQQIPDFGG